MQKEMRRELKHFTIKKNKPLNRRQDINERNGPKSYKTYRKKKSKKTEVGLIY